MVNIDLIVNARGRVCLIHDEPFTGTPLWVRYSLSTKKLEILFDNGSRDLIESEVPDDVHPYLLQVSKVLLVRMEGARPVEGFDTNFLREN